ncbi:MAG: hypothetical protein JO205_09230 [Pseudolabrys sp.]|nr:hypothetical protein [Pseudolabrys sp.]
MRTPITISLIAAAGLFAATTAASAQSSTSDQHGATGWSGSPGQGTTQSNDAAGGDKPKGQPGDPAHATTGQKVEVHDEAEAKNQPEMATGQNLNGPPMQFAPSKTPE